jgi:ankyrin repeat protein
MPMMCMKRLAGVALVALCSFASASASAGASGDGARLIDAVKSGNHAAVRVLLNQPGLVNSAEPDGTTALHWAVRADAGSLVQLLVHAGADVKSANRYGITPLSLAVVNGNAAIVETLVKAGADPNTTIAEGETVLMRASRTGSPDAIKVLLSHGADVNHRESWLGETGLMWAAADNHADAVQVLLEHGADPDIRSALTTFPKIQSQAKTANALVSVVMPRGGWTALMYAARRGALDAARTLVERGANLDLVDPDGVSALNEAIINFHYDLAGLLIERGADPNTADSRGMSALYAAVDMHTAPWIGARPELKREDRLESLDIIKMLLARGANPNAQLKNRIMQKQYEGGDAALAEGATPFMRAAKSGDVTVMRLLVEKGADPNLLQKNHTSALMMAAGLGWRDQVDRGTEAASIEAIKLCLDLGLDLNAYNDAGLTPLHISVNRGDEVMKFLVERGAKLDMKDKQGKTALDLALRGTSEELRGSNVRVTTGPLLRQLMADAAKRTTLLIR